MIPEVLRFKQLSRDPITVAIDSPGGSVAALRSLLGILAAPDQNGVRCEIYTAVTNRACSAAADLLAFGDYAVAFPHSRILFHDSRYAGLEDVTPKKAAQAAEALRSANQSGALKLANRIVNRIVWAYITINGWICDVRATYANGIREYDWQVLSYLNKEQYGYLDVVGFGFALFDRLSVGVDREVAIAALNRLRDLLHFEQLEQAVFSLKDADGNQVNLLDGIGSLYKKMQEERNSVDFGASVSKMAYDEIGKQVQSEIRLVLEVIVRKLMTDKEWSIKRDGFDSLKLDFTLVQNMRDSSHVDTIVN